jgi:RNA polymerase I-specific transcription initiation factor RRN6
VQGLITKAKASSLTDLYDRIITEWLYPLPKDISIRTRTFKEQTIRQLVGEISLARMHRFRTPFKSNIIELIPNVEENETNPPQSDRNQETVLLSSSDRTGGLASTLSENRKDRQENRGRLIPDVGFSILPSLSQTKSHLIFRKGINNVLSHWSLGMDPSSYDWSQTTIEEDVRRSQESTGDSRRRSKSGRSQGRILEDRPRLIRTSPIVPIIQQWEPYSQGGRDLPIIQSSQVTDDNLLMTQIERGAFGGRDATKKSTIKARKKKRAAGF